MPTTEPCRMAQIARECVRSAQSRASLASARAPKRMSQPREGLVVPRRPDRRYIVRIGPAPFEPAAAE